MHRYISEKSPFSSFCLYVHLDSSFTNIVYDVHSYISSRQNKKSVKRYSYDTKILEKVKKKNSRAEQHFFQV